MADSPNMEEVGAFDKSKLKKTETKEKTVLPTKADIEQAKVDEKEEQPAK